MKKQTGIKVTSTPHYVLKRGKGKILRREKSKIVLTRSHGCAGSGGPCSGSSCAGGCGG